MPSFYHFIHHLHGEKRQFQQISDIFNYANYANYQYKCFGFLRQSNKTNVIGKHSIAKAFAKMTILARHYCVSRYVRNCRDALAVRVLSTCQIQPSSSFILFVCDQQNFFMNKYILVCARSRDTFLYVAYYVSVCACYARVTPRTSRYLLLSVWGQDIVFVFCFLMSQVACN